MSFLAIIVALLLVQAWGSGTRVHRDNWFYNWQSRVGAWGVSGGLKLALLVLPPVLATSLLLDALEPVLFGLLWIVLAAGLLLYAFGRGDFHVLMQRYRSHCHSGDFEAAYLSAGAEFGWEPGVNDPESAQEVHALIQRELLYEGYQRWFAVLFYFVLLGPAGALAYRLLQLCRESVEPQVARRWVSLADWVPARLLAATFAVTGDFVGSRDALLGVFQRASLGARELLYKVAIVALGIEPCGATDDPSAFGELASAQNREFGSLLARSAVCWVVIISLLVLLY
jgi:AmpE protein